MQGNRIKNILMMEFLKIKHPSNFENKEPPKQPRNRIGMRIKAE